MLTFFENWYKKYLTNKAEESLMDFASVNMDKLSVAELSTVLETVHIIRKYKKVDNKS